MLYAVVGISVWQERVDDTPFPFIPVDQAALMKYAQTSVAIMLGVDRNIHDRSSALCPVQPQEAPGAVHLLLVVNHGRVVYTGSGKTVVPRRRGGVAVGAGVAGDIDPLPPQLNMQLVSLCRAVFISHRAYAAPGVSFYVVQA